MRSLWILLLWSTCAWAQTETELVKFGAPTSDFVVREHYLMSFNQVAHSPKWVLELLTADNLKKQVDRDNSRFRVDPEYPQVHSVDYARTGLDIGHLAPAADHQTNAKDQESTFMFSNAMPQYPNVNRGIWKSLETYIRSLLKPGVSIYVVTCPIWEADKHVITIKTIGRGNVWVPTHCGKAMLTVNADGSTSELAWIIPNEEAVDGEYTDYETSIAVFNETTGLNVFNQVK